MPDGAPRVRSQGAPAGIHVHARTHMLSQHVVSSHGSCAKATVSAMSAHVSAPSQICDRGSLLFELFVGSANSCKFLELLDVAGSCNMGSRHGHGAELIRCCESGEVWSEAGCQLTWTSEFIHLMVKGSMGGAWIAMTDADFCRCGP